MLWRGTDCTDCICYYSPWMPWLMMFLDLVADCCLSFLECWRSLPFAFGILGCRRTILTLPFSASPALFSSLLISRLNCICCDVALMMPALALLDSATNGVALKLCLLSLSLKPFASSVGLILCCLVRSAYSILLAARFCN